MVIAGAGTGVLYGAGGAGRAQAGRREGWRSFPSRTGGLPASAPRLTRASRVHAGIAGPGRLARREPPRCDIVAAPDRIRCHIVAVQAARDAGAGVTGARAGNRPGLERARRPGYAAPGPRLTVHDRGGHV